jgi:hypothetical protein
MPTCSIARSMRLNSPGRSSNVKCGMICSRWVSGTPSRSVLPGQLPVGYKHSFLMASRVNNWPGTSSVLPQRAAEGDRGSGAIKAKTVHADDRERIYGVLILHRDESRLGSVSFEYPRTLVQSRHLPGPLSRILMCLRRERRQAYNTKGAPLCNSDRMYKYS